MHCVHLIGNQLLILLKSRSKSKCTWPAHKQLCKKHFTFTFFAHKFIYFPSRSIVFDEKRQAGTWQQWASESCHCIRLQLQLVFKRRRAIRSDVSKKEPIPPHPYLTPQDMQQQTVKQIRIRSASFLPTKKFSPNWTSKTGY